jgi:hypothetical protein
VLSLRRAVCLSLASVCGCGFTASGLGGSPIGFDAAPDTTVAPSEETGCGGACDAAPDGDGALPEVGDAVADAAEVEAPPPLIARLNLDGKDLDGVDYPGHWTASPIPGVCGPYHWESSAVHGTRDPGLFTGVLWGNPITCAIGGKALSPGRYHVVLYFAEIFYGAGCAGGGAGTGARLFSVSLEGKTVLTDLDVFAAGGGCMASATSDAGAPVVQAFDVAVNDGTLDLVGTATRDNAVLSAIEVFGPVAP